VLRELAPLADERRIILVGGQAVAFWAAYFKLKPRSAEMELFTSKDIDFEGAARSVRRAGELLDGQVRIATIDDHTPNTGVVLFKDSDGETRELDFLVAPYGLDGRDVRDSAVKLNVAGPNSPELPVWVMHPERCMESRVYNVIGLKQKGRIAMDQLKRSVVCAEEFSRLLLEDKSLPREERLRAVLRLNERIFRKCLKDRAFRQIVLDHDVDPFNAVIVDDRLPIRFREIRYPQMLANLEERRKRSRAARKGRRKSKKSK
jgi:hypothetical protein